MAPRPSGRYEARVPLSRERVLRAGVAFADERGIDSLSMRKLGEALGVEAMSLYNHVANKSELLDGMVDLVFGEIDTARRGDATGRRRCGGGRISAREVLSRHRWAIGLMESRTLARAGDAPTPRRRHRLPAARRASRSRWRRTPSPCSTATSTASRCRRRACRSTPARRPPSSRRRSWRSARRRVPAPHRADRRARPPARLRLRRRVRVRARPDPRRSGAGAPDCQRRRRHDAHGVGTAQLPVEREDAGGARGRSASSSPSRSARRS